MTAYDPIDHLGLGCPSDAKFYICSFDSTVKTFLGCCTTDPCPTDSCPDAALRPSYFNPDVWEDIPPQACSTPNAAWWTCAFGSTFLGCCEENPCQAENGPRCDRVRPAKVSENRTAARIFLEGPAAIASETRDPTTTATTTTATPTGAPGAGEGGGNNNTNVLAAAVGAASGALALIVIAALIFWYLRRKRREHNPSDPSAAWLAANHGGGGGGGGGDNNHNHNHNHNHNIDPSSPYHASANPHAPYSPTSTSSPMVQRGKGSVIYSSGVSELDSQILSQGGAQPPASLGIGFNPAKGYTTSPGQSPYATPYASQANSPSPYQSEFPENRQSAMSGYAQSYGIPASPSPSPIQQAFLGVGGNSYASPLPPLPPGYVIAELASTPAQTGAQVEVEEHR